MLSRTIVRSVRADGKSIWRWVRLAVLIGIGSIVACTAGQRKEDPLAAQRVLVRAGFQFKTAESAEELAELKAMPQKKLFQHPHEGQQWYVYADVEGCNCIYYGDERNYEQLQRIISDQKAATRRGYVLQMDQRRAVEHGMAPQINWERWEN